MELEEHSNFPCTVTIRAKALGELGLGENGEEVEQARECLNSVWEIAKNDGKLNIPKDDIFLLRFIRTRKYNAELVYRNLKKYYEARQRFRKAFDNFLPTSYRHVFESGVIGVLKNRDEAKRRTFVFRMAKWNPETLSLDDITMASMLIAEQLSWCPINQCVGAIMLFDQGGLGLDHMRQITLPALHKIVTFFQDCFPGKYKGLHLVNQPYVLDLLCSLVKKIIARRLVSRIKLHRDVTSLRELIDPNILPESLGGNLSEEEAFDQDFVDQMLQMDHYYKELMNYGFIKNK